MLNQIPILTYCLLTISSILVKRLILHKTTSFVGLTSYVKYVNFIRLNTALFFSGLLTLGISVAIIGKDWFSEIFLELFILPAIIGYILVVLWLKISGRFPGILLFQARYELSNARRSEETGLKPAKTNTYLRIFIDYIGFPLNCFALFAALVFATPITITERECAKLVNKEFHSGYRHSGYTLFLERPIHAERTIYVPHYDPLQYVNLGDPICAVYEIGLFGFKRIARHESP